MTVAIRSHLAMAIDRLRQARQAAGMTIEEVSSRTKIKPSMLLALEQGAYDQLPGEFFTRAFLRTYARELHLPDADIVAEYDAAHPPVAPAPLPPQPVQPPPRRPLRARDLNEPRFTRNLASIAGLALVGFAVVFALNRPVASTPPEPGVVGTTGTTAATPAPASATPTPAVPAPEGLRITIKPLRAVWITGFADGSRVLFRLVEAEEEVSIEAADKLAFRVGDAGAFAFTLNGRTGVPPGRPGEVREFTITRATAGSYVR